VVYGTPSATIILESPSKRLLAVRGSIPRVRIDNIQCRLFLKAIPKHLNKSKFTRVSGFQKHVESRKSGFAFVEGSGRPDRKGGRSSQDTHRSTAIQNLDRKEGRSSDVVHGARPTSLCTHGQASWQSGVRFPASEMGAFYVEFFFFLHICFGGKPKHSSPNQWWKCRRGEAVKIRMEWSFA